MMRQIMKHCLPVLWMMLTINCFAQQDTLPINKTRKKELVQEFQKPVIRKMSVENIQRLKDQKEYAYMQFIDSVLQSQKNNLSKKQPSFNLFPKNAAIPMQRLLLLCFIIIVGIIVWHFASGKHWFFQRNFNGLSPKKNQKENIKQLPDFSTLAEQAVKASNYRLAIRYIYLHGLQVLAQQKRIVLAPEKTNEEYRSEMKLDDDYQTFAHFSQWYERAWFGHYSLAESQFNAIRQSFNLVLKKKK